MADKQNAATEDLQREVLESQLRTQKAILAREEASLEETMESLADRKQKKEVARRTNENRQRQFVIDRRNQRHLQQNVCQHRAGGFAGETPITDGDGFSVLHITIMPDGKTTFIQCGRCPLKILGRDRSKDEETKMRLAAESVEKKKPESFQVDQIWLKWADHLWWKELTAMHKKHAIKKSVMKGPTFIYEKDGVPFIPDVTGWVTTGPRN